MLLLCEDQSHIFSSVFQRERKTHDAREVKYQRLASERELWMNAWNFQNTEEASTVSDNSTLRQQLIMNSSVCSMSVNAAKG